MKIVRGVATVAHPLDYPVVTMDDWLRIKPWYEFSESRFATNWQSVARLGLQSNKVVCVAIPGGFDEPRQLMGDEALCLAYYEQPELIHDMRTTIVHLDGFAGTLNPPQHLDRG